MLHLEFDGKIFGLEFRLVFLYIGESLFSGPRSTVVLVGSIRIGVFVVSFLSKFLEESREFRISLNCRRIDSCDEMPCQSELRSTSMERNRLTSFEDHAATKEDELVGLFAERDLIRAEDTSPIFQQTLGTDDSIKEMASDLVQLESSAIDRKSESAVTTYVSIDSRERVVEKVDVGTSIDSSSEGNPSLLSAGNGNTFLSNFGLQTKKSDHS